jgi:hypothetical protein
MFAKGAKAEALLVLAITVAFQVSHSLQRSSVLLHPSVCKICRFAGLSFSAALFQWPSTTGYLGEAQPSALLAGRPCSSSFATQSTRKPHYAAAVMPGIK